jgi:membrane-bound lytic murein transglycosylase MltF
MKPTNWKVRRITKRSVQVVNEKTAFVDVAIRYDNGGIAYNFPEQIPQYVKNMVAKEYRENA